MEYREASRANATQRIITLDGHVVAERDGSTSVDYIEVGDGHMAIARGAGDVVSERTTADGSIRWLRPGPRRATSRL